MNKRPRWSLQSTFIFAFGLLILVGLTVFFGVHQSIWIELEIVVSVMAFFIFIFLCYLFYHGIVFTDKKRFEFAFRKLDTSKIEPSSLGDTGGIFMQAGAESGSVWGLIIGLLLDVVVSLLLAFGLAFFIAFLLWLGANVLIIAALTVFLPLFYIFNRSVRYVVWQARRCRGKVFRSFIFAGLYTVAGSIWFYAILLIVHYINVMRNTGGNLI